MKTMIDNLKKNAFWIVAALSIFASIYAFIHFLLPLDVFLWDESHHGYFGMQIYTDIRNLDLGAFWTHTNNQALWMPLHSWLDGAFLLLFGFSYTSARLSSLFLFFVNSLLLYMIGFQLSRDKGWLIGLISACIYLTSPILLHLASMNMQEMLGITVCLSTVYFMVRYSSEEKSWKYLCIGLLLSVTYWTKLNFAMQAVLGVGLYQLSLLPDYLIKKQEDVKVAQSKKTIRSEKKDILERFNNIYSRNNITTWLINNLLIFAGTLPLMVLWWATPPFARKFGLGFTFWSTATSSVVFYENIGTFRRVIYYLQSILSSYNLSFWIGLACLISIFTSFLLYKDKKIRLMLFMFLANLFLISIVANIQERYVAPTAPLLFVLLGNVAIIAYEKIRNIRTLVVILAVAAVLLSVLTLYDISQLTRYTKEVGNRSILFLIYKDSLNKFDPPFMFGLMKRPSFTYPMDQPKKYKDFRTKPTSSLNEIMNYFSSNIDRDKSISTMISNAELSPYVIYWHFHGWPKPVFSLNDYSAGNPYFWFADYFIGLDVSKDSPYYIDHDKKWQDEMEAFLLKRGHIKLVKQKDFSDLGIKAKIFRREGLIR